MWLRCYTLRQLSRFRKDTMDLQMKVHVRKISLDAHRPADWNQAKPFSQIPGPKPMPVFGNIWRFFPFVGQYYDLDLITLNTRLAEEYGKIVKLSGMKLRKDVVMLFDPDDIEMCYRNEGVWPHREGLGSVSYYRNIVRQDIFQGQGGVFTSNGEKWYQARSKLNQLMMQPRSTKMYTGPINDVAQDFINCIRFLKSQHSQGEMPEDFSNDINKWALESICTIALNKRLGLLNPSVLPESETQQFIDDVLEFFDLTYKLDIKPSLWKWISTPNWRKYVKTLDRINNLKYINEVLKKLDTNKIEKSQDELSILEQLLKKDKKLALAMVFDLLMAGIDTTARTVGAALYFLSKNQAAQEKLREECRKVLSQKNSPVTTEILNNIPYLQAVIKETSRLAPIAIGVLRRMPKDVILSGYQIPKGIFRNFSLTWPHEDMKWRMRTFYGVDSPLKFHVESLND